MLKKVDNFLNVVAESEIFMSEIQTKYELDSSFSSNKEEYLTKLKSFLVLSSGKKFEDFVKEGGYDGYNGKKNLKEYYKICEEIKKNKLKKLNSVKNTLILLARGGVGINESAPEATQKAELDEAINKNPEIKTVDNKIKELEKEVF